MYYFKPSGKAVSWRLPVLRQHQPPPEKPLPSTPLPQEFLPSSYTIKPTARGTYTAVVVCARPVADALLQSDYSWLAARGVDLDRLQYNGRGLVLETPAEGTALLAALQLRLWLSKLARQEVAEVEFTEDLAFLGEPRCAICLCGMKLGQRVRRTRCLHLFHGPCLATWLRTRKVCPIDKTALF